LQDDWCWTVSELPDPKWGDVVHLAPRDDLVEHDTGPDGDRCLCGPRIESVVFQNLKGARREGWLISHASLDGREHDEDDHDRERCPLCDSDNDPA
jgi:hypothetical protein